VLLIAGAALAALLLVIGQLIASRRITRLEQASERPGEAARIRRLEDALADPDPRLAHRLALLETLPAELDRLRSELAGLTNWLGELDHRSSAPAPLPAAALAVLEPLPREVQRLSSELAEVLNQLADVRERAGDRADGAAADVVVEKGATTKWPWSPVPLAALEALPAEVERLRRELAAVHQSARIARLERLVQRLAQQVAASRETTDFYAERTNGTGPTAGRTAVYVDVFLLPGEAVPGLAEQAADILLVRRTWGAARESWAFKNAADDVLAAFNSMMVNQFFDQEWARETSFWLAPAEQDVAELAEKAAGSAVAWSGVIAGGPLEEQPLGLAEASKEALKTIGEKLPLPGDARFSGVRWLVQFFGLLDDDASLVSACVKSLPHDLVAEATADSLRTVLTGRLFQVGRRQVELPPRPRVRGAALELEQLKADALRTASAASREAEPDQPADLEREGVRGVDQAQ
jgi:hypothetical protein